MADATESRTVRDPSTGEEREIEVGVAQPAPRPAHAAALPPLRRVIVDGFVCGEARLSTEVWDLLEAHGLSRRDAIAATLRAKQRADRIVIETGKKR